VIEPDGLARLALFADLDASALEEVAATFTEERHGRGTRLAREGLAGGGFGVILAGEVSVQIAGEERALLGPGEFFGEVSVFTGEPASADVVVASEELRCAVVDGPELRPLLLRFPQIGLRMQELSARRLRAANAWWV
jgi:CRP/FNR family transcriptional regulator, cyclic AMP receptor protein